MIQWYYYFLSAQCGFYKIKREVYSGFLTAYECAIMHKFKFYSKALMSDIFWVFYSGGVFC